MNCDRCHQPLEIGEHGRWLCPLEPHGHSPNVINDELEGGARFFETLGPEPVWIESKSQWRREIASRPNIEHVDRHDSAYYARKRRMHDEELRDTGRNSEY